MPPKKTNQTKQAIKSVARKPAAGGQKGGAAGKKGAPMKKGAATQAKGGRKAPAAGKKGVAQRAGNKGAQGKAGKKVNSTSATPKRVVAVRQRKSYTRPQFRRPHTYRRAAQVKPSNNTKAFHNKVDEFSIIKHPLATDMCMRKIEQNNTLTFMVEPTANKSQIRKAVRALYQVRTVSVNTLRCANGKKAYVRLAAAHDALDVANKIDIL